MDRVLSGLLEQARAQEAQVGLGSQLQMGLDPDSLVSGEPLLSS